MPSPTTIWFAPPSMHRPAITAASSIPATIPASAPKNKLPVSHAIKNEEHAPTSIMPSRPTFRTPLRSEIISPIDANSSGVVRLTVEMSHAVSNGAIGCLRVEAWEQPAARRLRGPSKQEAATGEQNDHQPLGDPDQRGR